MASRQQAVQNEAAVTASLRGQLGNAAGKTINGSVTIPENWSVTPTRGPGGFMYTNPENPAENYRLMPGDPSSTYRKTPYYRHEVANDQYVDRNGNVSSDMSQTHFNIDKIE